MKKNNIMHTKIIFMFFVSVLISCASCSKEDNPTTGINEPEEETSNLDFTKTIPIGSNSWIKNNINKDIAVITSDGIRNWTSTDDVISTYIYTGSGNLNVGLDMKVEETAKIKVTIGNSTKEIVTTNTTFATQEIGTFEVLEGYQEIKIEGIESSSTTIADINDLLIGGSAVNSIINFIPTSNNHFGRRGPSVHMGYNEPEGENVTWFYNEVTVPEGQAKLGSFFMTNGHSSGYFGMQSNEIGRRVVLFSIWSAFETDDPSQIPEDYQVTNLGNGEGVTVQNFGNEGSGKQSFIDVDWKEGVTYKFLLKGEPSTEDSGATDYTGYFYDPEVENWKLIASLRRPKTVTYLERLHSFLENFNPSTGYQERSVNYGNQWAYTTNGSWVEMSTGVFTNDATAANGDRLDYAGGTEGNTFFLKNCGFFNDNVMKNTVFTRTSSNNAPNIDFSKLPVPKIADPREVNLLERSSWTIENFSSQENKGGEVDTGLVVDVLNGDLNTYWHSCWSDCNAQAPHHITIDMESENEVNGIRFYQRQSLNRTVKNIEIQVSKDNINWNSMGNFELEKIASNQDIDFTSLQTFRYLKVITKTAHDNTEFATLAEIQAYKL